MSCARATNPKYCRAPNWRDVERAISHTVSSILPRRHDPSTRTGEHRGVAETSHRNSNRAVQRRAKTSPHHGPIRQARQNRAVLSDGRRWASPIGSEKGPMKHSNGNHLAASPSPRWGVVLGVQADRRQPDAESGAEVVTTEAGASAPPLSYRSHQSQIDAGGHRAHHGRSVFDGVDHGGTTLRIFTKETGYGCYHSCRCRIQLKQVSETRILSGTTVVGYIREWSADERPGGPFKYESKSCNAPGNMERRPLDQIAA